jgi:hypothetical protein
MRGSRSEGRAVNVNLCRRIPITDLDLDKAPCSKGMKASCVTGVSAEAGGED